MTPPTPNVLDFSGLAAIKRLAAARDPQGIKAAAQQFEAMFLQQVLQSMRDATPQDGMFDSEQTRMYQSLLDQQMAQVMASKGNGTGLAALIEKQLARPSAEPQSFPAGLPLAPAAPAYPLSPRTLPLPTSAVAPKIQESSAVDLATRPASPADFVRQLLPHADKVSAELDVPAPFIVAQAALESGWGKSVPRFADGRSSFNLFGVKAGVSWAGPTVSATTTEYSAGVARKQVEQFRAYGSYAEAFRDYVNVLKSNPRYAAVAGSQDATTFARSLQRAGYASDPQYAAKLEKVLGSLSLPHGLSA